MQPLRYALIVALLLVVFAAGQVVHAWRGGPYALLALVCAIGFLAHEGAKPTILPSFVVAILCGVAASPAFASLIEHPGALTTVATLGGIVILFAAGLETPLDALASVAAPLASLVSVGTVLTAFLMSTLLAGLATALGTPIALPGLVLAGAAMASTDPSAIVPSLKALAFRDDRTRHLAIAESAFNDVFGAVLTGVLAAAFATGVAPTTLGGAYAHLGSVSTAVELVRQFGLGALVGGLGFGALELWSALEKRGIVGGDADAALFVAVPVGSYAVATAVGGNGWLAVFVAGLLFHADERRAKVDGWLVPSIEGFVKPAIFALLGAMVDLRDLLATAPLGLLAAVVFMGVIRPLVVFITLGPFRAAPYRLTWGELWFLSFVRETGVISAVLVVGLRASGIPGTAEIVPVALWVILATLLVQPALTPMVARRLGIAT